MRNGWSAHRTGAVVVAVTALSVFAGCAGGQNEARSGAGWLDGAPKAGESARTGGGVAEDSMTSSTAEPAASPPVSPDSSVSDAQQSAALRAGSVDDNERWDDYLLYRQDFLARGVAVHDVDVSGRRIVTVKNDDGKPVLGATVRLLANEKIVAEAKTHADGRAFLFPSAAALAGGGQQDSSEMRVTVERGAANADGALTAAREIAMTLPVANPGAPAALDVMFVIDATGSMSDEIEQLKANVASISDQLSKLPTRPDVRFATTVFRDRGDAYVTRTFDFTRDLGAFQDALRAVEADGGGDTPEAVNAAVFDAIHKPSWRGGETVSLAFLIGDAAPHLDYPDDPDYAVEVFEAAKRGIKIEPIASSGLDDQGEYVFRQLAQLTGGRFSFLTYGAGGAPEPGAATTHHVKDYSVLSLDDLVVRLISEELAPLAG
jgi:Mg-chelatase subunit ChlD